MVVYHGVRLATALVLLIGALLFEFNSGAPYQRFSPRSASFDRSVDVHLGVNTSESVRLHRTHILETADIQPTVADIAINGFSFDFDDVDRDNSGTVTQLEFTVNLYFVASEALSVALFRLRDRNGDRVLDQSEFHEKEPAGSTFERQRDTETFSDLLKPIVTDNPYASNVGSSFLGASSDQQLVEAWKAKGLRHWVKPGALIQAVSMLLDRRVLLKRERWLVDLPVSDGRPGGRLKTISMPIMRFLYVQYQKDCNSNFRTLMLILLREGVGFDAVTPYQLRELPLLAEVVKTFRQDAILIQAMLAAFPRVPAIQVLNKTGFSFLHILSQPLGHTAAKRLLQVGDHLNFRRQEGGNNVTLDAAFQELSDHPGFGGAVWLGDIYETEYKSLWFASTAFREIESDWNGNGFPGYVQQRANMQLNEEFAMIYLPLLLNNTHFDLAADLSVVTPSGGLNFLHVLALNNWGKVASSFLLPAVHQQCVSGSFSPDGRAPNECAKTVLSALDQHDNANGRTPMALAQNLHGSTGADTVSHTLCKLRQELANTFDPTRVKQPECENSTKGDGAAAHCIDQDDVHPVKPTLQVEYNTPVDLEKLMLPHKVGQWDGGWVTRHVPSFVQRLSDTKCDFDVYHGLPTHASLARIVDAGRPAVFRGAAVSMGIDVSKLGLNSVRQRLGRFMVTTAKIPHRRQHSSPFREDDDVETTLSEYLRDIHDGLDFESNNELEAARYLFSSGFYREHPELLDGLSMPFDWVRGLKNTTVLRANDMDPRAPPLELNAQVYAKEPF
eukprot:INCI4129.3.p1 GENE.INCI4129.3~~INCI4129.3.p1  ORF type:complete len:785 (-),score=119.69 INCI4129.3:689-3043(-)